MNSIPINYQYGSCFIPSSSTKRNSLPGSDIFGDGLLYSECLNKGSSMNASVYPEKFNSVNPKINYESIQGDQTYYSKQSNIDLQDKKPHMGDTGNKYIELAVNTLGFKPDSLMAIYFSDSNITHLMDYIIKKVKENTTNLVQDGVTIQINPDDLFSHLIKKYRDKKIYNGSICFACTETIHDTKQNLLKLNSDTINEYVSNMVSQMNMYMYYYKDASQMPEQIPIPELTSMKGSRSLEYNTGLYSGDSLGVAAYSQRNNILFNPS